MAPGLESAVLLDLPHEPDQATTQILDLLIFTMTSEDARQPMVGEIRTPLRPPQQGGE